jgi:hypothetical protein
MVSRTPSQVPAAPRVPAAMTRRLAPISLVAALALAAVLAPSAPAIVPPKDCGFLTVKAKRYNIKADQMGCADAKRYSKNYLISTARKPKGYRCTRYGAETKLKFRCAKGVRNFFAIKR